MLQAYKHAHEAVRLPLLAILFAACSSFERVSARLQPGTGQPEGRPPHQLALIISGDNGWKSLERVISQQLVRDGIPVIGIVSPVYFRVRRTPEETAAEVARLVGARSARLILIGYSRGAGVMPFIVSRLPDSLRSRIDVVALIGLDSTIDFKVPDEREIEVAPEIQKLHGLRMLCIQGAEERDSLCPGLAPNIERIILPGGHRLTGDLHQLARTIESAASAGSSAPN